MSGLLDYIPGGSVLHRLNPLTKLLLAFGLCVACFLTNRHLYVLLIVACNLALAAMAGVFMRSLKILASLLKFSAFLFVVQVLFVRQGTVWLELPLHIVITDKGVSFALLFVMRLIAATMPLTLMLSVTQVSDIANVLVAQCRIPYKYAFALTTAIRFIPLFAEEMAGIIEAQTARGVDFDTKNFLKKMGLILPLCAPLLITSVRKIDSCAISARLRGFNLRGRASGYKRYPFRRADVCAGVCCALVILGSCVFG
ncbi:MAG: energy-coupling factor transporter transmembrane protein EcfT [Lachnospiraceae bacterium]|jgi:energy-coupling factor transport system permease protein|nr:energy-coupling factor transporter transmembrane protein EcfT [Lachnospiraceae bacterium]